MAQVKPLKLLPNGNFAQIDIAQDELTSNTLTSNKLTISDILSGEKLVIHANNLDSDSKLLSIYNSASSSVAYITEKGEANFNSANIGSSIIGASSLEVTGSFSIDGNSYFGTSGSLGNIYFYSKSSTNLDMNLNKINNLDNPTDDYDAVNKKYLLDNLTAYSWALSGNSLSGSEFIGSANDSDIIFKRNSVEMIKLTKGSYTVGGIDIIQDATIANTIDSGDNTIVFSSKNNVDNKSHSLHFRTGNSNQDTGNILIETGVSSSGNSGDIILLTDVAMSNRGSIHLDSNSVVIYSDLNPFIDDLYSIGSASAHFASGNIRTIGTSDNGDFQIMQNSQVALTVDAFNIKASGVQKFDANNKKIVNVAEPTSPFDAANKQYVDSIITSNISDVKIMFGASGNISSGSPVFVVTTTDQTISLASASSLGTSRLAGIAENSILDGESGLVTIAGFATIPIGQIDGGAFNRGEPVFLSENFGNLTSTPPSNPGSRVYQVGVAVSSTKIIIDLKQGVTVM